MVEEVTIALIGLIVTGVGIFIALLFNIKAVQQNTKNLEYQVMKDVFKEFHDIQKIPIERPSEYIIKINNFSQMILELHLSGIVKKNIIVEGLSALFAEAYWIHNNMKGEKTEEIKALDSWCDENNIKPVSIVKARTKVMGEITTDGNAFYCEYKPETKRV